MGIMQFNKGNTERAKEDVRRALASLNTHLLTRTYLVGERISLADISVCCTLLHLYQVRERERGMDQYLEKSLNKILCLCCTHSASSMRVI